MTKLSSSDDRGSFALNSYLKRKEEKSEEPDAWYLDLLKTDRERQMEREQDPEWQKDNLEYDLRTTDWILQKARLSRTYAQNLYAALCNNDFQRADVLPILKDQRWHCSWRYAGGIIAHMRQEGDYIDWYCSGYSDAAGLQPEGAVTEEIRADLLQLGWIVIEYEGK